MSINLTVVIDNDEAIRKFRELQKTAKTVTSNVVTDADRMDIAMRRFATTLGQIGIGVSLTGLIRQIALTRGEFQQLEVAFTTLLQSKEKADALMSQMVELAAKTPFDLQGVANGARQLLAYGFAAEDVTDVLTRLGNVAAGLGLNLQDLTWLYGTTAVQGRLYTRDVMQFQSRGIDLAGELATQLGKTRAEISQMVTEGKIGFPEVQKAIENMTNEGGKFYNLMQEQSKTITGLISNLGDAIDMMFNDIGKSQEGVITSVLQGTISLVENYQKVLDIVTQLVIAYGTYKTALIVLTTAEKLRYQAALAHGAGLTTLQALTDILTAKTKALNKALLSNPYVLAAAAAAALAVVIYNLVTAKSAEERAMENVNKAIDEYNQKLDEQKSKAEQLHAVMQDDVSTAYSKQKAYQDLIKLYPELLEKYSEEEIKLISLIDLTKELNRINDTRKGDNLQEQYDTTLEKVRKLKQAITDAAKNGTLSAGYYTLLAKDLRNAEADLDEYRNKLDEFKKTKKAAEWANAPVEVKVATLQGNIDELKAQNDEIDRLIEEAKNKRKNEPQTFIPYDESEDYYQSFKQSNLKKIADIQSEISSLQGGDNKAIIQNKSYWENLKKEAVGSLEAMDASLKGTAKWNELVAKIAEYDKKIKQYSVSSKTEAAAAKAQKKLSDSLVQAELDLQSQRITIMREGKNKRLAEIDLEYQQTAAKINQKRRDKAKEGATEDDLSVYDQQMTAAEQKRLQNRAQVETEYAKQTAETYRQLADVFLTEEERKTRAIKERYRKMRREQLDKFLGGDIGVGDFLNITAQINKAEIKSMLQDVLREYETFEQKKARITEEYNDKIARLEEQNTNGQYNENIEKIKRQRDLEIAQLQISESDFFQVISGNLEEYGLATIRDAIAQAKEYLDNFIADAKSKNGGKLTNEQLQFVTQMRQDLDKATKVVHYRLPEGLAKAASGMKKVADSAKELDESLGNVLDTVSNMIQGFSDIESGISGLKEASANFKQMKQNAKDQGKSLGFGDILGTVGSYAGAIGSIVSGVTGIFSSIGNLFDDQAKYAAINAEYARRQEAYWESINFQVERYTKLLEEAASEDYFTTAAEQMGILNESLAKARKNLINDIPQGEVDSVTLGLFNLLRSGKQHDYIANSEAQEIYDFIQQNGGYSRDEGLSIEAAYALKESADIWSKMPDWMQESVEKMIEINEQTEELKETLNESLFQTTSKDLEDAIIEGLKNGKKGVDEFGGEFEEVMRNALLQSFAINELRPMIKKFYEKYTQLADSDENGKLDLTKDKIDTLRKEWNDIITGATEGWENFKQIVGYTESSDASTQSATSRGYQIATQDDITEQNGRLTDIQGKMSILVSGVDKLSSLGLETKNEIVNMRDIMIQLNGNVADIRTYTKVLPQMSATLISMDRKLNNL